MERAPQQQNELAAAKETVPAGEAMAKFIFFALGVGNLFPFNAFVTAAAYYQDQFCNTAYESTFLSFFATIYTASQPIALFVNVYYHNRFSLKALVQYPLYIYTVVFGLTTMMVLMPFISPSALFGTTLVFLFIVGIVGSIMNGGLFAMAGTLPKAHTSAIMIGQGMAGLMVSLVSLIVTAGNASDCSDGDDDDSCTSSNSIDYGDFSYFLVACIVLSVCIWLFVVLLRLPFIEYNSRDDFLKAAKTQQELSQVNALHNDSAKATPSPPDSPTTTSRKDLSVGSNDSSRLSSVDMTRRDEGGVVSVDLHSAHVFDLQQTLRVAYSIRIPSYAVFVTYFATLMVYPSVMVQITPLGSCHTSRFLGDLWLPCLFLFYNLGDFVGRIAAGRFHHLNWITSTNVHWAATMRFGIPLMMLFCHVDGNHLANVFDSDAIPPLLTLALGLTNGFVANMAMMIGPGLVAHRDAPLAGTIMQFWLVMGLLGGSLMSFLLLFIVTGTA